MKTKIDAAGRGLTRPADTAHPNAENVRFRTEVGQPDDPGCAEPPQIPTLPKLLVGLFGAAGWLMIFTLGSIAG